MAQLRDSQSSELIAEGTPEEIVLIAEQLPNDSYLFDDVSENFNPQAVLTAREEQIERIQSVIGDAETRPELQESLKANLQEQKEAEPSSQTIQEVENKITEARARIDEGSQ